MFDEYSGWRSSSNPTFRMTARAWDDVWAGALSWWNASTHPVMQLSLSLLLQCYLSFSDQISAADSCDGAAIFKIVNQYNSLSIPEYSCHNSVSWATPWNFLGGGKETCFQALHTLHFTSGSKWWSQVSSSTVKNREIKLSGFLLNRWSRRVDASTRFADDDNVICMANGWLEDQQQQFFYNGIQALEKCWTKCILL